MMALSERAGSEQTGEARERGKMRRFWRIFGLVTLACAVTGLLAGLGNAAHAGDGGQSWAGAIAIAASILFVVSIVGGGRLLKREVDEMALAHRHRAAMFAMMVYFLTYPVWWMLWKGGLVVEPQHLTLFIIFYVAFVAGCIYQARTTL